MVAVYLLILWMFSPLVLIPLAISQRGKIRKLTEIIAYLREEQPPQPSKTTGESAGEEPPTHPTTTPTNDWMEATNLNRQTIPPTFSPPAPATPPLSTPATPKWRTAGREPMAFTKTSSAKPPREPMSAIHIVLGVGILFVLLAGLIFATTNWQYLSNLNRTMMVALSTALFFGGSFFADKQLKLRETAGGLYLLGCLFITVTALIIGYFSLFGTFFSLWGVGKYLLGLGTTILFGIACGYGATHFRSIGLGMAGLFSIHLSVLFLFQSFYPSRPTLLLLLTLYSLTLALLNHKIDFSQYKHFLAKYIATFSFYTVILLSLSILFWGRSMFVYHVALLGVATLILVHLIQKNAGRSSTALLIVLGVFIALSGFNLSLTAPHLYLYFERSVSWQALLSAVGYTLLFSYYTYARTEKWMVYLQPFPLLIAIKIGSELLFASSPSQYVYLVVGIAYWLAFFIYTNFLSQNNLFPLRSLSSDLLLVGASLLNILNFPYLLVYQDWILLLLTFMGCSMILVLAMEEKDSWLKLVSAFAVPFSFLLFIEPLTGVFPFCTPAFIYGTIMVCTACATIFLCLTPVKLFGTLGRILPFSGIFMGLLYSGLAWWEDWQGLSLGFWCIGCCQLVLWWRKQATTQEISTENLPQQLFAHWSLLVGVLALELAGFLTTWEIFPNWRISTQLSLPFAIALLLYLGWHQLQKRTSSFTATTPLLWISLASLSVINMVIQYHFLLDRGSAILQLGYCLTTSLITFVLLAQRKKNLLPIIPLLGCYPIFFALLNRLDLLKWNMIPFVAYLVWGLLGRLCFRKSTSPQLVDCFHLSNLLPTLYFITYGNSYWTFIGWLMLAVWIFELDKRVLWSFSYSKITITLSILSLLMAYWNQPFIRIPDFIEMEFNLLPLILLSFIMKNWVWKEQKEQMQQLPLAVLGVVTALLTVDALVTEKLFDALFIGCYALIILSVAFYGKRKGYFLLSTAALVILGVYLTRSFWLNLAWWIYLLLTGIFLISIASLRESYRQKGNTLLEKLKEKSDHWRW